MATSARCPICGRSAPPRPENRSFPFCGDRCRLVDLSKWFGGEYRIAGHMAGDGAVEGPPAEDEADGEG